MDKLLIPITGRSRQYGYIFWFKAIDSKVKGFLGDAVSVGVVFEGADHGVKNVDWKNRRISIGWRWTRQIPQKLNEFELTWKDKQTVSVKCR
jgi:hypothetical protein